MPRLNLSVSVLFFLISFSSESHSQTQPKESKSGTATISGQVRIGNEPLPRVTVILQDPYNINSAGNRVKTDNDGRFLFSGISAGNHLIDAVAPNYINPGNRLESRGGRILNVSEGENIENIEIELVRGGVISGKVTDPSGSPIVETYVTIAPVNQQSRISSLRQAPYVNYFTDDRGIYRIYGIPAGRYLVSVGTSTRESLGATVYGGIYIPQTFHPDATEGSKAKVIELSEGEEVSDVDISVGELKKIYHISGRVVDIETGAPAHNVSIRYGPVSRTNQKMVTNISGVQRSTNRGEFALSGFVPGTYKLYVMPDDNGDYYSDALTVEVTDEDVAGVELKARRGGMFIGVVTFDGVSDPKVLSKLSSFRLGVSARITGVESPSYISTRVNPDGTFSIKGLPNGKYRFQLTSTEKELRGVTIVRVEKDGMALPSEFDFVQGQQFNNLRIVARYGNGAIRGSLSILGGTLPAGTIFGVMARRVGAGQGATSYNYHPEQAEVDTRGKFLLEHLSPDDYELLLSTNYSQLSNSADQDKMRELSRIYRAINNVRQRISVTNGSVTQVTLVLDLGQKEDNR
jgi:hypothetical protein